MVSQNADGLHHLSGIPYSKLSDVHGSAFTEYCPSCGKRYVCRAQLLALLPLRLRPSTTTNPAGGGTGTYLKIGQRCRCLTVCACSLEMRPSEVQNAALVNLKPQEARLAPRTTWLAFFLVPSLPTSDDALDAGAIIGRAAAVMTAGGGFAAFSAYLESCFTS